MRHSRSRSKFVIFSLAMALAAGGARAQKSSGTSGTISGEVYQRERADHQQSLLIDIHGAPFDEVIVDTPKRLRDKGSVGYSTGDWKWEADGALRFHGPAATNLRARIDYSAGTKLPDHLPVKINYLGSTLFSGKYDVTQLPALGEPAPIGDMVTFPSRIEYGQPFTFHTTLPDPRNLDVRFIPDTSDVPLKLRLLLDLGDGTMWTTGVRHEEPKPKGAEHETFIHIPDYSVRIDKAEIWDRWGELVARGDLDMSIWPEIPSTNYSVDWTSIVPRLGLTYSVGAKAATLIKSNYAQYADQLYSDSDLGLGDPAYSYSYATDYFATHENTVGGDTSTKPTDAGEPDLFVDRYACFDYQDGNGNGVWDSDELGVPDLSWVPPYKPSPGIHVPFKGPIVKDKLWWFGSWEVSDIHLRRRHRESSTTGEETPRYRTACGDPEDMLRGRPVLRDRRGHIRGAGTPIATVSTKEIDELPVRSILPLLQLQPGVIQAPEMGLVGQNYCVCGDVPTIGAWGGLQIGNQPLGAPLAATSHSATFQLPNDLPPGPQSVSWINLPNGDSSGTKTVLIKVEGSIDQNKLLRGEATQLQLRVRGTTKALPFQLQNFTPAIVSLEGGNKQTVTTSGGAENVVRRQVQAKNPGNFNIQYVFDLGKCPCSAPPSNEVKQTSDRTLADMAKDLGSILDDSDSSQRRPSEIQTLGDDNEALIDEVLDSADNASPKSAGELGIVVNDRDADLTSREGDSPPIGDTICKLYRGFEVRADWATPDGESGQGTCTSGSNGPNSNTATFSFSDSDNTDLLVKILDGCDLNGNFWVFYGGTSGVEYNLTVTDPKSGQTRHWMSPSSKPEIVQDTHAFATCP